jgi:hypothetical protein
MGAVEAREERRKRGLTTLEERLRQDPDVARRMDVHLDALRLEQQFVDAMRRRSITSADLARLVNRKPAGISRDLAGGLSEAKLGRVREMANAVGYDVVAVLVPRDPEERREALNRVVRALR